MRLKKEGEETEPSDQGLLKSGCSPEADITRRRARCQVQPLGGEGAVLCKERAGKGTKPV